MTIDHKAFQPLRIDNDLALDLSDDEFPTSVLGFFEADLPLARGSTHYGMVTDGECVLNFRDRHGDEKGVRLTKGMFFSLPGAGSIFAASDRARGLVIQRLDYLGLFQVGGPLEEHGRLKYIDGCSDTLLIGPPVVGEPCLNHLHMPIGVKQTQHTHPSSRIGVILRGNGECVTPNASVALTPGMGWYIPTGCEHSFYTFEDSLDVVAWHPETDTGPSHENHPMLNRTYATSTGQSARDIDEIRTQRVDGLTAQENLARTDEVPA